MICDEKNRIIFETAFDFSEKELVEAYYLT